MDLSSGLGSSPLGESELVAVLPWVRHLDAGQVDEFAAELTEAPCGDTGAVHRAIVSWRATARVNADPEQLRCALQALTGDPLGPVRLPGAAGAVRG
ncbi:hypothetical protein ACFWPV_10505 [Streptomyces uncialis]|uniref:hypothetical protein n=1 Tax=Streptomyces uncialis TaxID=1048205 RepID=UPI003666B837